jgi:hypothetical protein
MRQVRMAATPGIHIKPKMEAAFTVWVELMSAQKMPDRQTVSNRNSPTARHVAVMGRG